MKLPRSLALTFLLALAPAPAATAQTWVRVEVTPTIGYRTGGGFTDSSSGLAYDVEPSGIWGAIVDVALGHPGAFLEVAWSRQESRVGYENAFGPGLDQVTFDSFLLGGQWDTAPASTVRPFLGALVGVTLVEAPGSSTTRFTGSLSGGVKLMVSRSLGVRLEGRALGIFSGGSSAGLCGSGGCTIGITGWGTLQLDASAGLVVAF